ncbi:MAG: DUF4838 domain-containing protein [Phycisphaeraceae bacterium]
MNLYPVVMAILIVLAGVNTYAAPPLKLVDQGHSVYSIYHAPAAPDSVKDAARELQTYIAKATGAQLAIVTAFPDTPVIALGEHDHLKAHALSVEGIKPEGYRIVTKSQSIFIFGPDDAGRNAKGGISRGTQNGVYTFLETFLGIRWLMPGDAGEYVPKAATVTIPPTALSDAPDFANRRIEYIREKDPQVQRWMLRNKLGYSIQYMHGHNWDYFTTGVYDFHPEVFTLRDGKRVRPVGGNAWLCTTNPETVRLAGLRQVGHFMQNPTATMASISPTDGHGLWCQCEACTALDEKLPDGQVNHSRRIITFYNQVSEFVTARLPDKLLGGYIYLDYIEPPADRSFRFHPSFYPVFAPLFYYGPMAYRQEERGQFHRILDAWAPMAEGRMCFYGLPRLLQGSGRFSLPVPPGRKVLADIYPALKKANFGGARVDGMDAWGYGGAYNWVTARLLWHADADVDQLCEEYYAKCYGKGGAAMSQLYGLLEEQTEKYIVGDPTATYHMQPKAIRAIYLPVYARLEELYQQAQSAIDTDDARQRLELFGWSMRGLYRVLEDYGWLLNARQSVFYMSEPDFIKWLETQKSSIYISPGALAASGPLAARQADILRTPVTAAAFHDELPNAEAVKPYLIRFKNHLVLLSEKEGEVRLTFKVHQTVKGGEVAFKVYDTSGSVVTSGQAADEREVTFLGAKGGIYHVFIDSNMLSVTVTDAAWAIDTRYHDFLRLGRVHLNLIQQMTPLYFYVPKGTAKFSLGLSSTAPGETCAATLYDPQNKAAAQLDTAASGRDSKTVASDGAGGWWKLVIGPAETGVVDDVFLELGDEIPGYVCTDPGNRLVIETLK